MIRVANEKKRQDTPEDPHDRILNCLKTGKSVRINIGSGGRVHMDRPLPFICVYELRSGGRSAAYDVTTSNASYLIEPDLGAQVGLLNTIGQEMYKQFGAFLVIQVSEFAQDRLLSDDSPYLPEFEIDLYSDESPATHAAMHAAAQAIKSVKVKYRSPLVNKHDRPPDDGMTIEGLDHSFAFLSIRFAPIYQQPEGEGIYPDLRERLIADIFDALLQGIAAYASVACALDLPTHRAFGRRVFVDAVKKLDTQLDEICGAFDFLMAVTPINSDAAWAEFKKGGQQTAPDFLYRPLTIEIDAQKRSLFSIPFDYLEDPVLYNVYRGKQQELDLQLTALNLRDSTRFREASALLYGPVEADLLKMAEDILALPIGRSIGMGGLEGHVDCYELKDAATRMIGKYRDAYDGFGASVAIRDDLPPGLMVSGPCLMISRSTQMSRARVEALLSHEIGVHLMTYFAGDAQGLKIFRTGLAGYEGLQEGLGVFAEYLVGGLTPGRLRLLAVRVVGCAAMLDGADFTETYRLLKNEHGFSDNAAFNVSVRLYRSGGFAKDAIYLRGLRDILNHLAAGKPLDPFWLGKFSATQLPVIEELTARGLLRSPPVSPTFLNQPNSVKRLAEARKGLTFVDLISV